NVDPGLIAVVIGLQRHDDATNVRRRCSLLVDELRHIAIVDLTRIHLVVGRIGVHNTNAVKEPASSLRNGVVDGEISVLPVKARAVVRHDLQTIFRQREEETTMTFQDTPFFAELCPSDICLGGVVDFLRIAATTMGRINIHAITIVATINLRLSRQELVAVLVHVCGVNGEEPWLVSIMFDTRTTLCPARSSSHIAAGPCENSSIRVPGTLRAVSRKGVSEI